MSLTLIGWLFTCGALAHNAEEARYLPAWSQRAGRFRRPVSAPVFHRAAVLLSLLFLAITAAASLAPPRGLAAYLMAGYALAMVLNALLPHAAVSVLTRSPMPGLATGVLLNMPLGTWYLVRALRERQVTLPTFYWAGPAVVLALLLLLPALLAAGRGWRARRA